jgi:hypothetical protein
MPPPTSAILLRAKVNPPSFCAVFGACYFAVQYEVLV